MKELSTTHLPCSYRLAQPVKGVLCCVTGMKSVWPSLVRTFLFLNLGKVEFSLNCKQWMCLVIPAVLLLFVSKCWIFPISFYAICLRLAFVILLFGVPANMPENGLAEGKLRGCLYEVFLYSLLI